MRIASAPGSARWRVASGSASACSMAVPATLRADGSTFAPTSVPHRSGDEPPRCGSDRMATGPAVATLAPIFRRSLPWVWRGDTVRG